MKKKTLAALVLACAMLMGTVSAAWSPVDFAGGALSGIVADGDGVLVSDVYNKVLWRIEDGEVEQAVGQINFPDVTGEPKGRYEDGTLGSALFMEPWAVTPFLDGYAVSDTEAHVVRYFDDRGVYTAAGSGKAGNKDGSGTGAAFNTPTGLATGDQGEVYIADTGNGSIRVMAKNGAVTTLVKDLVDPTGLCWANGALYIAETGRNRICKIQNNKMTVVAGLSGSAVEAGVYEGGYVDGPVAKAEFDHPQGVAVDQNGVIYVADTGNSAVRKISGGRVTTLAAARETPGAPVQPRGILAQGNTLLVTDLFAQTVLKLDITPVTYKDVPASAWCYEAVTAATERGITGGTGNGYFSPDRNVTRAQFVTMLSRMHLNADGYAVIGGDSTFSDVAVNAWCVDAVKWAADQDIITGYENGTFGPNNTITRQQLVTMLYRYAQKMGYDVSVGEDTNILSYNDFAEFSEYAIPALQWACGAGVISGYDDGTLKPHQVATRAQTVQILMNAMNAFGI